MLAEHEPKQTAENALVIEVGDKRILYSRQGWYTNKDIARAVGRSSVTINQQLHKVRENDNSIEFTTLGELNRKGKSALSGSPQTIVCNEENFIKAVIAVVSIKTKPLHHKIRSERNIHKSPASKDKKPKNPGENSNSPFNPFSSAALNQKKPQETHRTPPKETLSMKFPEQILGINSVIKVLSHLANATLEKDIPNNIKEFLEQVAMEHVQLPHFEGDPKENILEKIFYSAPESYLNIFLKVNLEAMLYDLWDVIDTNERKLKEEKKIIELCNKLKEKGYDKKGVIQEVFTHFGIPIPSAPVH